MRANIYTGTHEIRELKADEIDNVAGGAITVDVPLVGRVTITTGGISVGGDGPKNSETPYFKAFHDGFLHGLGK